MTNHSFRKSSRGIAVLFLGLALVSWGWPQSAQAKCECEIKMAAILENEFSYYSDNTSQLEFDFDVDKKTRHVEVALLGQDFDAKDRDWAERDEAVFSDFIAAVGQRVSSEMEKPMVRLQVIGQNGRELSVYRFEE